MTINETQKKRLIQTFIAVFFLLLSNTLMSTYRVPDPPPLGAFLTSTQILHYTILQFVFLISFIGASASMGMFLQAKEK